MEARYRLQHSNNKTLISCSCVDYLCTSSLLLLLLKPQSAQSRCAGSHARMQMRFAAQKDDIMAASTASQYTKAINRSTVTSTIKKLSAEINPIFSMSDEPLPRSAT